MSSSAYPARAMHAVRRTLILAATLIVVLAAVLPAVWLVLTSLRPQSEIYTKNLTLFTRHTTLANYSSLLTATPFGTYIVNSVVVCTVATAIAVLVSLLAAYSFSRRRFPGRSALLLLVVFSQLFPYVILITPIFVIFHRLGLVDTRVGLILAYVAITIPFCTYLLLGYLDTIPRELDEAALIDGESTLGIIFRVIFPTVWPGIAATTIYAFANTWNEYVIALTLISRDDLKTIPLGLAGFYGQYTTRWDLVMTASVFALIPTLLIFLFLQRYLVSGLLAGSVKQ